LDFFQSAQLDQLAVSLAKAQGEMENVKKGAENPFFKSKYADLASVWEAARVPLSKNGLSVIQSVTSDDAHHWLETTLLHSSGQFVSDTIKLTLKDDTMQGLGSAITYARRYQLSAFVGVSPDDDDDGNAASGKVDKPQNGRTATKPPPETQADKDFNAMPSQGDQLKRIADGFAILGVTDQVKKGKMVREWGLSFDNLDAIEAKINELVNLK
jgi:hypothetical protein